MLTRTEYQITQLMMDQMIDSLPTVDHRVTLNQPTSDFFYDAWEIKPEFKNTVWEEILSTLPDHGEARIIKLKEGECYTIHADIDDRWHLNISGENSYLVDLMTKTMYPTINHTSWFLMNTGILHSAVNFGNKDRYQLVVRKLLNKNSLSESVTITIDNIAEQRYLIDQIVSPWLNYTNKNSLISNFKFVNNSISFKVEKLEFQTLTKILDGKFNYDQSL